MLRALKKNDVLDFYLAGIKKNYRGQGVDLLMVVEMARGAVPRASAYREQPGAGDQHQDPGPVEVLQSGAAQAQEDIQESPSEIDEM